MVVILMGVAGAGKTTIGRRLADELGWPFLDGDDFHSAANIEKMACGSALTDADRELWLQCLRERIAGLLRDGRSAVIACSALKRAYREKLMVEREQVRFVYLKADYELVLKRLQSRLGHFMKAELLHDQFETMEEPQGMLAVDADQAPARIIKAIRRRWTCPDNEPAHALASP